MRHAATFLLLALLCAPAGYAQVASPNESVADSSAVVYVTRTGGHYHRDGCRHLQRSKRRVLLRQISSARYTFCRTCAPPLRADPGAVSMRSAEPDEAQPLERSVQCEGLTRDGKRCRRRTLDARGLCHLHRH